MHRLQGIAITAVFRPGSRTEMLGAEAGLARIEMPKALGEWGADYGSGGAS